MNANDRKPQQPNPGAQPQKQQQQQPQEKQQQKQQQQSQPSGEGGQYGEGNYKATRDYNAGVKEHMEKHDIEREARDAAPRSEEEARAMEQAEKEGKSKSRDAGRE